MRSIEERILPPESLTPIRARMDQRLEIPALVGRHQAAFEKNGLLPSQVIIPAREEQTILILANYDRHEQRLRPGQCSTECDARGAAELQEVELVGNAEPSPSLARPTGKAVETLLREATDHLPKNKQEELLELLRKHKETVLGPMLGKTLVIQHEIATIGKGPLARPAYRLGRAQEEFARAETNKMLEEGLLRHSKSPWSAPVIIAKKPKGGCRYCADFRALNEITRTDSCPMLRTDVMMGRLGGMSCFSTMDAERGFFQVAVREQDRVKTALASPAGLVEYNVMPMGLINSPATFQRLMDIILRGLHKSAACFIDDVVCFTKTFEEHLTELEKAPERLQLAGITLNLKKC
eukprot:Plantae.Rhodophyta-Hildenbrandia_rubra.ctg8109.p1 GENE.Plantae.Rhodophyta-Hildenbrandia_rubra.ctg8109~~Plantae.Rhodophyta-Hildenbrandia_rubra.ctg8109.p1  ORF type:complete len:352 (+),score=17.15 Plantae.Rhodophyta-Hildenbrandia_rubra.ctg8109:360-1415(+)